MSDPAQHSRIVLQKCKQEEGEHREFTFISQLLASPYRLLLTDLRNTIESSVCYIRIQKHILFVEGHLTLI